MKERERMPKAAGILLALVFAVLFSLVSPVGRPFRQVEATSKKNKESWVEKADGYMVYYDENGERSKGLVKIDGKKYYFDSKGHQLTGWQEIDGTYYYFRLKSGKKGYMVKSDKVNGIKLKAGGKAKVTSNNEKKLQALVLANDVVEEYTTPSMSKKKKMKAVWNHLRDKKYYTYGGTGKFVQYKNWDAVYALQMLDEPHRSVCYGYGAAYAYLANACGCKECKVVSNGSHGWAEIDGKVYDPKRGPYAVSISGYYTSYSTVSKTI